MLRGFVLRIVVAIVVAVVGGYVRWTGMPSWKETLSDQLIWTPALFLKHMDKLPPAAEQAWRQVTN